MENNLEDLLFKCLKKYEEIMRNDYKYVLEGGMCFLIIFKKSNFAHLLGLHKLTDINTFKLLSDNNGKIKKGQAEIIYRKIKNKTIKYSHIAQSNKFYLIKDRIKNFLEIKNILSCSQVIINFNSKKLEQKTPLKSYLKSNVIFFKKIDGKYIHLCIVNKSNNTYPESFFVRNDDQYITGQIQRKILKKSFHSHLPKAKKKISREKFINK